MIEDLILKNRSYRKFDESVEINTELLKSWVNLARLSASSANLQMLKYIISNDREMNREIFESLGWARYLKDWKGPESGQRPSAYIVILGDTQLGKNFDTDTGIVAQSILLGAVSQGFGGCMIADIKKNKLREDLSLADEFEMKLVIALGKPAETIIIDDLDQRSGHQYWRDENDVHHVPKRPLSELILNSYSM